MSKLSGFALAAFFASTSWAVDKSPYTSETDRVIKALSPEDATAYVSGKGMGYAKAAELNGYPGPMHVLELSDKLALTAAQKSRTQSVFDAMKSKASETGKQIVEKESELDRLFVSGTIDESKLSKLTQEISRLNGEYRRLHLQAHLEQKKILTEKQIQSYADLRGYGKADAGHHSAHPH